MGHERDLPIGVLRFSTLQQLCQSLNSGKGLIFSALHSSYCSIYVYQGRQTVALCDNALQCYRGKALWGDDNPDRIAHFVPEVSECLVYF